MLFFGDLRRAIGTGVLLTSHVAAGYHVGGGPIPAAECSSVRSLRVTQSVVAMAPAGDETNPLFKLFAAAKANAQKAVDDAKNKLQDELSVLPDNDAWKQDPKAAFDAMALAKSGMSVPAEEKADVHAVPPPEDE